jgi:hypothetical protein
MQILDLLCCFIQVLFLKMIYLELLLTHWWGVLKGKKEIILRCIWLILVWRCITSICSVSLLFLKFPKIISRYANLITKFFQAFASLIIFFYAHLSKFFRKFFQFLINSFFHQFFVNPWQVLYDIILSDKFETSIIIF